MQIVLAVLVAMVLLLVRVFIIGTILGHRLPVGHVASRSATFAVPPERVWDVINDPAFMRARGVGDLETETVESVPPRRLVRRIVGESHFGGTWTSELDAGPAGGPRLVITKNGEIYNASFRFASRYIVGHHRTIDSFLTALRRQPRRAGRVTPERPAGRIAKAKRFAFIAGPPRGRRRRQARHPRAPRSRAEPRSV